MESDNVELLFETNTISQIEEIEAKLRKEIEKKKDDLKQIVGERYRDLIEVSDGLQIMNKRCNIIVEEIGDLEKLFQQFKSNDWSVVNDRRKDVIKSQQNKAIHPKWTFTVKCKIIVKSPSKIWYFIDKNDMLSATFYYGQALHVWESLKEVFVSQQNLVTQYADIIVNFARILVDQAWSNVNFNGGGESLMAPENVAVNLVCISILQHLESGQLLEMFLQRRYQTMVQLFADDASNFHLIFLNFFSNLFDTSRLVYLIFVEDRGVPSLLQRTSQSLKQFKTSPEFICNHLLIPLIPDDITNFRLRSNHLNDELSGSRVKEACRKWTKIIQEECIPKLAIILRNVNSVVDLFAALRGASNILNDSHRLLNWQDLNGVLFDGEIDIWQFFLKEATMEVLKRLICSKLETAYDSLHKSLIQVLSSSSSITQSAIDVVWGDDASDRKDLTKKAFAITDDNFKTCSDFEEQLSIISEQLSVINDDSVTQVLIPSEDLQLLQDCFNTSLSENLEKFLQNFESIMDQSHRQETSINDLLTIAYLYRTLIYACPKFKDCHHLFNKDGQKWINSRESIRKSCYKFFTDFLTNTLTILMETFAQNMRMTVFIKFLDISLTWEEISLEETLEDGKTIRSNIRIPIQVSIPLYNLFKELSSTINRIAAHTMSKVVVTNILKQLGVQLTSFYRTLLEDILGDKDSPRSLKQTQILQFYFDLNFIEQFYGLAKDETIRKEVIPLINDTTMNFQGQIDPFDLHALLPHFQSSLGRCLKCNALLLGNLISQSSLSPPTSSSTGIGSSTSVKTVATESKLDSPNLMPSYSLSSKFPLLPAPKGLKI